jgi:hypothetical protein
LPRLGRKSVWGVAFTLTFTSALVTRELSAQTDTLAESLFRDARAAMREGHPERACPLFAESYRLDPAHGTLFNLGACEAQRGKLASAWAAFRKLIDLAPSDDERVVEATERLQALEQQVPRLRLVLLEPLPYDHALELDGVTLGPGAVVGVLRVDPGKHMLRVMRAGEPVRSSELEVAVGQTLTYEVEPVVVPPRAEPEAPVQRDISSPPLLFEPPPSNGMRYAAYTALGLGGAGLVASLSLGVLALRARDATDLHCPNKLCDAEGMAAGERGAKYASLATASAVAGLVGMATGGVFLWQSAQGSTRVRVTGSGATFVGTF